MRDHYDNGSWVSGSGQYSPSRRRSYDDTYNQSSFGGRPSGYYDNSSTRSFGNGRSRNSSPSQDSLVTMALEMMVLDVAVTSLEAVQHAVKAFHQVVVSVALLVLLRTLEATTTHQEQQVSEAIHLQEDNIKDDNISKVFVKRHPRFGFFLPKKSNEL